MQRRALLTGAGAATVALGAGIRPAVAKPEHRWKLVTTWPKNFPGMGTGANKLAELIGRMSGGRIEVKVYGAGELVPAFEIFDAVSRGTAEMGHGAAYYWKGKSEAAQFFASVPFGLTAQEMNSWLYYGGGMELWQELYAGFGLVPAAAANTGVQMGGWFNKEINSVDDLKGLKMRIPGLGGEVLKRAGGTPVSLPGGEIFTSLQSGNIDATEWVGPYNDLAFGLHKAAKYYYYPGWHEPGTTLEAFVNKEVFDGLPDDLQAIVLNACKVANQDLLAEYTARNPAALRTLLTEYGVELRQYPDDVLLALRALSTEVVAEIAEKDAFSRKTYASYQKFLANSKEWSAVSELAYLRARDQLTA
ncbi:MAG: TRAP transporter substrate-binding protein [Halochromatium sp.]|uniref:TRAP transporter substrate-binding protein n=1 Tax=Halochromatium sp. TaxID=2049430 RepID=UPI00397D3E7B